MFVIKVSYVVVLQRLSNRLINQTFLIESMYEL